MFERSDTVKAYNIITNMYLYGYEYEYTCNAKPIHNIKRTQNMKEYES